VSFCRRSNSISRLARSLRIARAACSRSCSIWASVCNDWIRACVASALACSRVVISATRALCSFSTFSSAALLALVAASSRLAARLAAIDESKVSPATTAPITGSAAPIAVPMPAAPPAPSPPLIAPIIGLKPPPVINPFIVTDAPVPMLPAKEPILPSIPAPPVAADAAVPIALPPMPNDSRILFLIAKEIICFIVETNISLIDFKPPVKRSTMLSTALPMPSTTNPCMVLA